MQIFNIASIYKGVVNSDSFSVHDFDILTLYPLDFEEFLWANAEFALTREIRNHFSDFSPIGKKLHEKALSQFRLYTDHRRNACCHYGIQKRKEAPAGT